MNALVFSLLAAGCTCFFSLCFRKNSDHYTDKNSSASGYLVLFYLASFLFCFILYPDLLSSRPHLIMLSMGACVGILNSVLMFLTARALKRGPAGLTFAFQNASAIFPGLILFGLLGSRFGFNYSYLQVFGIVLALFGLFLGASKATDHSTRSYAVWLKYALACFILQILALTLIQGRCVLFKCHELGSFCAKLSITEQDDIWFMPGLFGAALLIQLMLFFKEGQGLKKHEMLYGSLGGLANFASTAFLLLATKFALPFEKVIIFPLFAISTMVLCNIWANRLYQEKFHVKQNVLCSLGIFLAAT